MKIRCLKLFLSILIFVMCITMISTVTTANSKYGHLTGVNWYGFETQNLVPHGLWARDYKSMLQQIKDLGFNCIRLPWCVDALTGTPSGVQINAYATDAYTGITGMNLDLQGLNSMQVMDKIIDYANTLGLKIILDCHSIIHDNYMNETVWYTSSSTESDWINAWKTLVTRYKSYPNVIGCDLKNEPHGSLGQGMKPPATWGYDCPGYTNTNWKAAAERCGQAILAINSSLVIFVEGTEMSEDQGGGWWGGNLKDVAKYPITAIPSGNLEYSCHEYGSKTYNQTWFSDPNYPNNLSAIWDQQWYYIVKQNIGQLYMGEFGIDEASAADPNSVDYKWLTTLLSYVGKNADFTFWCFNANADWGILGSDMVTVYPAKYKLIKPYLAGVGPTPTPGRNTPTPTVTPTPTPTRRVVTNTPTPTPTVTHTPTPSPTANRRGSTPTPTPTGRRVTVTPTPTPTRAATPTPTAALTPTPTRQSPTPTPTTRGSYVVAYVIQSDWGNGATISVTITNNSASAVNGWTLAFTFPGNQTITNLWNATYTQSGASVSVKDGGFNANIPAGGGSVNFGFNLNYSGTNAKPASFTLNGTVCQVQ